ncbi:pyroglutamyl-peptidase I family protein [Mesorhizobium sp. ASY16-5R]|uniref:pyroglutamyl-peptidase I family protein n=1 Tax=Mesorhizobium sp. ASY16-5R TaxID=3445772 RepID=UPI003FA004AA
MGAAGAKNLPRVLVTGFEPFPGAPVNPTQRLVERLRSEPPRIEGMAAFRAELLPVDYEAIGPRLSHIGRTFAPDIALHFGLAHACGGFRLERLARNSFLNAKPGNSGFTPVDGPICKAPALLQSRLPLQAIHDALTAEGLPVVWSDDAGGYLCNVVLTLSLAAACEGFSPRISGFIHVPMVGEGCALSKADFIRGFGIVLRTVLAGEAAIWPPAPPSQREADTRPSA